MNRDVRLFIGLVVGILVMSSCTSLNKGKDKDKDTNKTNSDKDDSLKAPFLTAPKVRKVWIPEKIENEKFIEGHWMWVIERGTSWGR